jgi:hypothetical protein
MPAPPGQGGQLEMSRVVLDARPVIAAPLSEFGLVEASGAQLGAGAG